jgi:PAS domain S-box-containing protein
VVTFFIYFNLTIERQLREGFEKKGISLVQTVAFNLGAGIYSNDSKYLQDILKGLENDTDVNLIMIIEKDNSIKFQNGTIPDPQIIRSLLNSGEIRRYSSQQLLIKQSIFFRDIQQGILIVGFNLDWIKDKMTGQKKTLIYLSASLALVLFILATFMAKVISNPLKKAAATIREYSNKSGTLELHLPIKGNDEISQLAKALNNLSDNLDNNILALSYSKRYLETIFQLNPIPIIIADTLGQIEKANESACGFFGIQHELLVKMRLENFIQKDDLNVIFNRIIQERQNIRNYVTTIDMTDGLKKVVELSVASHVDENELIKNVIITAIDITDKIQIQREISENKRIRKTR